MFTELDVIKNIYIPAARQHKNTFGFFSGMHKGETIVIFGTGKTYKDYNFSIPGHHIAINHAIRKDPSQFRYFFTSDYDENARIDIEIAETNQRCKKFYPFYNHPTLSDGQVTFIPAKYREAHNSFSFFGEYVSPDEVSGFTVNPDITCSPLTCFGTTSHFAFQFALWTRPKTIYLVGMDCQKGHCEGLGYNEEEEKADPARFIDGWRIFKQYTDMYYPDTHIIVVNPVGLKGVFEETNTK